MISFGLDIGTSKICLVVADGERVVFSKSLPNCFLREKEQSAEQILASCRALIDEAAGRYGSPDSLGISTQMHGILYVDKGGNALSPLYTWQDKRGGNPYAGTTVADYLTKESGYRVASGYGLVTHFALLQEGGVPAKAKSLCTVGDYVALHLAPVEKFKMHPTCAASLGFFNLQSNDFDREALGRLGFDTSLLPEVDYKQNVPVIGDNQASYRGAVGSENALLINIGTGSQVSVLTDRYASPVGEVRPYTESKRLLVGSALCGGYAYTLLKKFFQSVADALGVMPERDIFESMNSASKTKTDLRFDTLFSGTRECPDKRAVISNLSEENFTAGDIICACQEGIVRELKEIYEGFGEECDKVVGAGNGIRRNAFLRSLIEREFHGAPALPPYSEEAAYGALLWAKR